MTTINFLKLTCFVYLLEKLFSPLVSACTWPTALQNGVWIDSDKGSLTFNATHMSGWRLKTVVSSIVITEWVCQNNTGDFLIARASNNIDPYKSTFIAFLCLKMTQVSNYSFYYYQHSAEQPNSNYERFEVTGNTNFASFINNLSNMCTDTPATSEFHMLLKQGFQNESKLYCPDAFLGMFSYTFNNGSTTACGNRNELWDVCSDRKVMTFNYKACTQLIAYSVLGKVYCVNSLTTGTHYYAAVYSTDTTVNSYRFTCLMGSLNGNDVFVSQSPNSCTKTQNTTSVPVIANGTSLGAFMYLRAYNTCRFETPSTNTSTTNVGSAAGGVTTNVSAEAKVTTPNVGAIVGGICGVLFLILLVGSVILFYLCVLKKTPTKKLLKEKYTNGEIAERKQSTPYREDKKENSLAKANVERSNNTEVISTKRVEENKIIQETGEKIHFTDQFLFSKEGTGLDVTQKPPMETAYRQTPIFDRDRSNIMFVVKENIPEKTLDSKAPKTDINSSSVMVTPAGNMTKTMGDAGPLVYRSLSPLLDKAHVISISKANQEDESKRFTSNATFALSVTSTRPTRFRESDKSTEHVQEYPETDSARDSSDEDAKPDDVEAEHVQTPMDTQVQSVDSTPSQMAKSLQKNAVSGFNKHGGLPPLGFDSPSNKSHKHKKRRKKKRKNKFKVSPSD